jgi:hypothetical protein
MTDREVDFEHRTMKTAKIFESAAEFGLTPDEILKTVTTTLDHLPGDARGSYIDQLAGALATRLLEKQRGF